MSAALDRRMPKALSYSQKHVYAGIGSDWTRLPAGHGCTSRTLANLETRGLVEMRTVATPQYGPTSREWQIRRVPG